MHNARPAEVVPHPRRPGRQKTSSRGVDVPEKGCMMCGSVGHFGADGSKTQERGAEAGFEIFDSVRR